MVSFFGKETLLSSCLPEDVPPLFVDDPNARLALVMTAYP